MTRVEASRVIMAGITRIVAFSFARLAGLLPTHGLARVAGRLPALGLARVAGLPIAVCVTGYTSRLTGSTRVAGFAIAVCGAGYTSRLARKLTTLSLVSLTGDWPTGRPELRLLADSLCNRAAPQPNV
jgi:hypothetical protein